MCGLWKMSCDQHVSNAIQTTARSGKLQTLTSVYLSCSFEYSFFVSDSLSSNLESATDSRHCNTVESDVFAALQRVQSNARI